MTIGELKKLLEEATEYGELSDDSELRFAYQESWPLQSSVRGTCTAREVAEQELAEEMEREMEHVNALPSAELRSEALRDLEEQREMSEEEAVEHAVESNGGDCLYLVEGGQLEKPYAPKSVFELARSY